MRPAPAATTAPERVRIFGETLSSDRPLPGLPVAPLPDDGQSSFWELRTADATGGNHSHSVGAVPQGLFRYSSGPTVTLALTRSGAEIVISDTGRFALDGTCRQIMHTAPAEVDRAAVALDVIGMVLPYALHRLGAWCLHASAVETPQGGVLAFVAPSGTGKSTLSASLLRAGCRLVADDVVVLRRVASGVSVRPSGVPLRLRSETARTVSAGGSAPDGWGKVRIDSPLATGALPLTAVYVLVPVQPDADVARAPRAERAAALALLTNGKITELLGADAMGDALDRCIDIAAATRVYDLAIPRDFDRLGDVVATVLEWHRAGGADTMPE